MRKLVLAVVVAVLAWVFVVPSCSGRFDCEASGRAVARADHGECPSGLADAAADRQWARDRLASLANKSLTTGLFYDEDGNGHVIESGRDDDSDRAVEVMRDVGVVPSNVRPNVADHVEVKVAALMRESEVSSGVLVINFPRGVCGIQEPQPFSCAAVVPAILPKGATLTVWSPREVEQGLPAVVLRGDSR